MSRAVKPIDIERSRIGDWGIHRGVHLPRLPVRYLRWGVQRQVKEPVILANGKKKPFYEMAALELQRRGDFLGKVEIAMHAIDRASVRYLDLYLDDRKPDEGLFSWLDRIATEVWERLKAGSNGVLDGLPEVQADYKGMKLLFDTRTVVPVLKTLKK